MELILRAEDANDWVYKGEGAANIVLGYNGFSVYLIGKVLRIQKAPRCRTGPLNSYSILSRHEVLIWRNIGELEEPISKEIIGQAFIMNVMGPLLDPKHVDGGICVSVTKGFLECVENNVLSQRPTWRVTASELDTLCDSAFLYSDHSVLLRKSGTLKEDVCFAVEIKPKCGYLPNSEFISKRNTIKKSITRFKMHQLLKLHQGEISQLSQYSPLDLFSGNKERIYQAISALFTTPQNNFRVFFNGSHIFGDLDNRKYDDLTKICGLPSDIFIELIAETILSSLVLDRLLSAQKLDAFDIEGVIHAYYDVLSQPCLICETSGDPELLLRSSFIHAMSLEESMNMVRDYLISATAKDCSLMISFRHMEENSHSAELSSLFMKSSNQNFEYKVNFIDLDMKPLQKIVYYYELDQKIVSHYTKCNQNKVIYLNTENLSDEQIQK